MATHLRLVPVDAPPTFVVTVTVGAPYPDKGRLHTDTHSGIEAASPGEAMAIVLDFYNGAGLGRTVHKVAVKQA